MENIYRVTLTLDVEVESPIDFENEEQTPIDNFMSKLMSLAQNGELDNDNFIVKKLK